MTGSATQSIAPQTDGRLLRRLRASQCRSSSPRFLLRRQRVRLAEHRIIGVALGTTAIKGRLIERVQRRAAVETLDQVRIGDEQLAERNQIGLVRRKRFVGEGEMIAVVAVNFDAVKTRLHRVRRAAPESFDDAGDFLQRQGPRLADIGEYAADEGLAFGADRRRSNGSAIIRLQGSVRNAPDVPDLNGDASAWRVQTLRPLAPT